MSNDTTAAPTSETLETTTEQTSTEDVQKELARLKDSLKRANAEAKQHREKAAELDRLKAESEAAKLSETERLQKQLAKLQADYEQTSAQLREERINASVASIAGRLGFADPDD